MGRVGIRSGLSELATVAGLAAETLQEEITEYATRALTAVADGNKLMFCGNGGSAADAQHLAAEYVVRMAWTRPALPALALTADTSVLTACANDRGFDEVFARQVAALGRPGDLLVIHSVSGDSVNLVMATAQARRRGVSTVGLLGSGGGQLAALVDVAVRVPTERVSRAQEVQLAIGHIVCRYVEESLFGDVATHTEDPFDSQALLGP